MLHESCAQLLGALHRRVAEKTAQGLVQWKDQWVPAEDVPFLERGLTRDPSGKWVDAEEAYLGIAVTDRDDGQDWLSETYWISDIALADRDPEEVRRVVAALERSIAKVNAWLAEFLAGRPATR